MSKSESSRSILERATYSVNANGEIVGGRRKETFFGKIEKPFIRFGQLMGLSWRIAKGANVDDMTIRVFKDNNDILGVPISGYNAKQNRGASEVFDIACKAKREDGVSQVVINIPQRDPEQMYHQIVIR